MSTGSYHSKKSTYKYTADFSSPFPVQLKHHMDELRQYTIDNVAWSIMMVSETQAKWLNQFVGLVNAKRVLEIGTFTGYSAMAQAAALPSDGKLIALDVNKETMAIARRFLDNAQLLDKVELRLGPAAESIENIIKQDPEQKFDFIFMDADKTGYITYYNLIMDNNLLSDHGAIVCDNVLRQGKVISAAGYEGTIPESDRDYEDAMAIHAFNEHVSKDTRVQAVILPLGDGMTIIRKA
ncbi:O-methyltransferase [Lichtheimia hyalospora FSU 10163]|nr:O-methyltransferase [Lichtheimia hyalospora FSU 10163]